jgi:hypothetical protein
MRHPVAQFSRSAWLIHGETLDERSFGTAFPMGKASRLGQKPPLWLAVRTSALPPKADTDRANSTLSGRANRKYEPMKTAVGAMCLIRHKPTLLVEYWLFRGFLD